MSRHDDWGNYTTFFKQTSYRASEKAVLIIEFQLPFPNPAINSYIRLLFQGYARLWYPSRVAVEVCLIELVLAARTAQ